MKKVSFIILCLFMFNITYSFSQIRYNPYQIYNNLDSINGKVKKIETFHYYPKKYKPTKVVSEYDSLGRKISEINYYIKNNPQKETFHYDSIGNISMWSYEYNNELHYHTYEYKYDNLRRIVNELELRDNEFSQMIDSVIYNKDNLPVQYLVKMRYAQYYTFISYPKSENIGEKRLIVEKKQSDGVVDRSESIYCYNSKGFLSKKILKTNHVEIKHFKSIIDEMKDLGSGAIRNWKHSEEYEYVDYKYDKHGNWIEYKCYLDWENKGRALHYKVKRKIEYW